LWTVPDGALLAWLGAVVCDIEGAVVAPGAVGLLVDCAQAGAATNIVVINRGAARLSDAFITASPFRVDTPGFHLDART
jgi:hypothetical protein